jgi:transcription termination factor Rho
MKISTLQDKKLDELRAIARELDLSGYSKLRKQDLIYRILEAQAEGAATGDEAEDTPVTDGDDEAEALSAARSTGDGAEQAGSADASPAERTDQDDDASVSSGLYPRRDGPPGHD